MAKKEIPADRIIALAAVVTAVASLTVAVWQGIENRRHNRLSVRPHLVALAHRSTADSEFGLRITNKGAGPAFVNSWQISVDDQVVGEGYDGWISAMKQLDVYEDWVHFGSYRALQEGESFPIFFVTRERWAKLNPTERQRFEEAMRHLHIRIEYNSTYNETDVCIFNGKTEWNAE